MALLIFCDTETTGLNYDNDDEIWELHAKAAFTGHEYVHDQFSALIHHEPDKIARLPEKFQNLHDETWNNPALQDLKLYPDEAGIKFRQWLSQRGEEKAHFIAANPAFDAQMIWQNLMSKQDFYKIFDYHLIDIEAFALGYLRAREIVNHEIVDFSSGSIRESFLPFKSDDLSRMLGVYDEDAHKHTAESDVDWLIKMWLAMNGGKF